MLDIEGRALSPADRALLREPAVGGVILFTRNYESPPQLADLVTEIRALRNPPLLIAADHEGGRVQRFRDGFTRIPPMRQLGMLWDEDAEEAATLARTIGWMIGSELRAMGVDLSFTPCVDLDWGVSEVIGDRSFHRDPEIVSSLAVAYCRGLREAGMAAVGKHFPGHGAVAADSHERLPFDRREYGELLDDMRPYERLIGNGQLAAVMLSHVVYAEQDALPAGFSAFWIQRELDPLYSRGHTAASPPRWANAGDSSDRLLQGPLRLESDREFRQYAETRGNGAGSGLRHGSGMQRSRGRGGDGGRACGLFEPTVAGTAGAPPRHRCRHARITARERRLAYGG